MTPMTDRQLNDRALDLLCEITSAITKFQVLRDEAPDDAWDSACDTHVWLDVLTEVEAQVEQYM